MVWVPRFDPLIETLYRRKQQARSQPLFRLSLGIGVAVNLVFSLWDLHLDPGGSSTTFTIRLATSALMAGLFLVTLSGLGRAHLTVITHVSLFVIVSGVSVVHALLPNGFGYGVAGLLLLMIFGTVIATDASLYLPAAAIYVLIPNMVLLLTDASPFLVANTNWFLISGALCSLGLAYVLDLANRRAFRLELALSEEQRKSELLLRSILPATVADRLKSDAARIADFVEHATVLFADLVGFTSLAHSLPPEQLLDLLDQIFTRLDAVAARHRVEKIKTVGDAYMAAVGVAGATVSAADDMAEFALEAREVIREYAAESGLPVEVRIGMCAGPVISGVIGKQKPHFDLWGDTVNTASRLESAGLPGEIQVDEQTYRRLRHAYRFTPRGAIPLKGLGLVHTYVLSGRAGAEAASQPDLRPIARGR